MRYLLTALLIASLMPVFGQNFTSSSDNDPKAAAILEKIKAKYNNQNKAEVDFKLEMRFPEQDVQELQGKLFRDGDQYYLDMGSQSIICNQEGLYMVMHHNKEVMINDLPEEGDDAGLFTPQSFMSFYERGDFTYAITSETYIGKTAVYEIEFKPLDEYADYSKLRLTVEKNSNKVRFIEAFGKDSSKYKFILNSFKAVDAFKAGQFAFDKANFEGYHVEDLRE